MAIIPPTNAVVHPRTVVIKILKAQRQRRTRRCREENNDYMQILKQILKKTKNKHHQVNRQFLEEIGQI